MAGTYNIGEQKVRPGIYSRISNGGGGAVSISKTGIVAVILQATWGPLNIPQTITSLNAAAALFGVAGTTAIIARLLKTAQTLRVVRAGTGGGQATRTLQDTAGSPANVITLTAKHKGVRGNDFKITIQDNLLDGTKRDAILYEGAVELERYQFVKGSSEVDGLVGAMANSPWITATKIAAGNGTLAAATQSTFTGATDPTVSSTEYSAAMNTLEGVTWSVLCLDTHDTTIQAVAAAFIARLYGDGKRGHLVLGEPSSVTFSTRLAHAAAFNSKLIVYVAGGGIEADGGTAEGYEAAADIAGLIASTPNKESITHLTVPGWLQVSETFSSSQIAQALQSGVLIITAADDGTPRVEQGITTLVTPAANEDAGWKKIKRGRSRFELFDRIDAVLDPLIGRVNNDAHGRAEFTMQARNVINAMISEQKLSAGTDIALDPSNPPIGDSAYWAVAVVDPDAIEKVYLAYQTNFDTSLA